jgi:molybdenum cofactor guanylyltransferase
MNWAGIVVCGGQSRRMGGDKARLRFGSETMLQRVVGILSEVVEPIVVVGAAAAELPSLPDNVLRAFDRQPQRGPMEGLAVGLKTLAEPRSLAGSAAPSSENIDAIYLTSCDVPLLLPDFIRRMMSLLGEAAAAVPQIDGRLHPLAAVYRTSVLAEVERRLAAVQLRMTDFVEALRPCLVGVDELRDVDPQLQSLRNINDPDSYAAALAALEPDGQTRHRRSEPPPRH